MGRFVKSFAEVKIYYVRGFPQSTGEVTLIKKGDQIHLTLVGGCPCSHVLLVGLQCCGGAACWPQWEENPGLDGPTLVWSSTRDLLPFLLPGLLCLQELGGPFEPREEGRSSICSPPPPPPPPSPRDPCPGQASPPLPPSPSLSKDPPEGANPSG